MQMERTPNILWCGQALLITLGAKVTDEGLVKDVFVPGDRDGGVNLGGGGLQTSANL